MEVRFSEQFEKDMKRIIRRERFHLDWFDIPYQLRRVKWFFHRGRHGWAAEDVWGFDDYLTKVIAGGLRHLKKHGIGYPGNPWHKTNMTRKKWEAILEQIATGFEAHGKLKDEMPKPDSVRYKKLIEQWNTGHKLFVKYFGNLWD